MEVHSGNCLFSHFPYITMLRSRTQKVRERIAIRPKKPKIFPVGGCSAVGPEKRSCPKGQDS